MLAIYAGTKGWTDSVPVSEVRRFAPRARRVLQGQPPGRARVDPEHRDDARRGRAGQGADVVPRGVRHGEGRLSDGRRPRAHPAAAHPQRAVHEEDHQGDGADRRLADRARPGPDRGQPPLPRGNGAHVRLAAAADPQAAGKLLGTPESPRHVGILAVAGDRGLAGSYNSGVLRATERRVAEHRADGAEVTLWSVGRRLRPYFRYRGHRGGAVVRPVSPTGRSSPTRARSPPSWRHPSSPARSTWSRWSRPASSRPASSAWNASRCCRMPLPEDDGESDAAGHDDPDTLEGYTEFEPEPEKLLVELAPRALEAEVFAALLEGSRRRSSPPSSGPWRRPPTTRTSSSAR